MWIVVRIFKTIDGAIHEIQEPQEGCWIALTNPTATEIFEISEQFGIEVDDLRAPLDAKKRSHHISYETYREKTKQWIVVTIVGVVLIGFFGI